MSSQLCPVAELTVESYCFSVNRMATAKTSSIQSTQDKIVLFFDVWTNHLDRARLTGEGEAADATLDLCGLFGKIEATVIQTNLPLREDVRAVEVHLDVDLSTSVDIKRRMKRFSLAALIMRASEHLFSNMNPTRSSFIVCSRGVNTKSSWEEMRSDTSRLGLILLPADNGDPLKVHVEKHLREVEGDATEEKQQDPAPPRPGEKPREEY
jgi:hypothetical protein